MPVLEDENGLRSGCRMPQLWVCVSAQPEERVMQCKLFSGLFGRL